MLEAPFVMKLAQELARYSGARQAQIAKNIANADTPGYRARDLIEFSDIHRRNETSTDMRSTRTGHMLRDHSSGSARSVDLGGEAAPNGNNVSLEEQMSLSTDARSNHDLALTVYRSSLDILRTSLGRGR